MDTQNEVEVADKDTFNPFDETISKITFVPVGESGSPEASFTLVADHGEDRRVEYPGWDNLVELELLGHVLDLAGFVKDGDDLPDATAGEPLVLVRSSAVDIAA